MTERSRFNDLLGAPAYGNVWAGSAGQSGGSRWPALVRQLRLRLGLSQAEFAGSLGVKQASVSRWENGHDLPSPALRRQMRAMQRSSQEAQLKRQLRARLMHTQTPTSIVGRGARFLDFSNSYATEAGVAIEDMRGSSIYGHFGELVDVTTRSWERSGIFKGDIAFTLTVLSLQGERGEGIYLRNFDMPCRIEDDIISICEVKRISQAEFDQHLRQYGGAVFFQGYEDIGQY